MSEKIPGETLGSETRRKSVPAIDRSNFTGQYDSSEVYDNNVLGGSENNKSSFVDISQHLTEEELSTLNPEHADEIRDKQSEDKRYMDADQAVPGERHEARNIAEYDSMSLMQLKIEARHASELNDIATVKEIRDLYEHHIMERATDPNNTSENWTQEQFDEQMAIFDKNVNIENNAVESSSENASTAEVNPSDDGSSEAAENNIGEAADSQEQDTDVSNAPEKTVHSRIEEINNSNMSEATKKEIIDIIKNTEEYESELEDVEREKGRELANEVYSAINELESIQDQRDSLAELRNEDDESIAKFKDLAERMDLDLNETLESIGIKRSELEARYKELDEREAAVRAKMEELGYKLPEVEGGEELPRGLFAKMKNGLSKMYLKAASIVVPAVSYFEPSKLMIPKRNEGETDQEYEKREKNRRFLLGFGAFALAAAGAYAINRGLSSSTGSGSANDAGAHLANNPSIVDNSSFDSINHIGNVDTSAIPDSGSGLDTLGVVDGGSTADVVSQFSPEARTVASGEGWYNTFSQMNISPSEHHALLDKIGPELQNQGWAYFDHGWKISHTGQLPDKILEMINNSR